jgi:hypothetical protein
MDSDYGMAGVKKKAKKRKKAKKASRKAAPKGFKVATEKSCLRGKRKLKKGCIWGRGRFKGKLLRKTGK